MASPVESRGHPNLSSSTHPVLSGTVSADGQTITWSDGTTSTRTEDVTTAAAAATTAAPGATTGSFILYEIIIDKIQHKMVKISSLEAVITHNRCLFK